MRSFTCGLLLAAVTTNAIRIENRAMAQMDNETEATDVVAEANVEISYEVETEAAELSDSEDETNDQKIGINLIQNVVIKDVNIIEED